MIQSHRDILFNVVINEKQIFVIQFKLFTTSIMDINGNIKQNQCSIHPSDHIHDDINGSKMRSLSAPLKCYNVKTLQVSQEGGLSASSGDEMMEIVNNVHTGHRARTAPRIVTQRQGDDSNHPGICFDQHE